MSIDITPDEVTEPNSSRRALLTKGAMAAAVAAVAGIAISGKDAFAGNANNTPLQQGAANTGASLTTSLAGGGSFQVVDGGTAGAGFGAGTKASIVGSQSVVGRAGVAGEATGATGGTGVFGRTTSASGFGVHGVTEGNGGIGVFGEHTDSTFPGTGVRGRSNGGAGVVGDGSSFDFAGVGSGRLNLKAGGLANPPAGNFAGTIASDTVGNLWFSPVNGVFQKLNAPSFHPISPVRVYDSRSVLPTPGKLGVGLPRVVSIKDARDPNTGAITALDAVPAGVSAVFFNLTATETENSGYLSVVPGDAVAQSGSSINWTSTGIDIANGLIGKVDALRQVKVFGGGGGQTHFVIDITGYFL